MFENTIGIWFLGITGNRYFANEVFYSKTFSELRENTDDKSIFDQSFLLTRFSNDNIDEFMNVLELVKAVVPDEYVAYAEPAVSTL